MSATRVIDLFAGAGGLALGAAEAGADVRVAIDHDAVSCDTLRSNAQHADTKVIDEDVCGIAGDDLRELAGLEAGYPLVVVGGAPCQPFSKAAYWVDPGEDARWRRERARGHRLQRPAPPALRPDDRRSLVGEFWRLVVETDADGFCFENVPSILHPRNRPVVEEFQRQAEQEGYHTRLLRLNAVEFGVPQRRRRALLLGARATRPGEPQPSHADSVEKTGALLSPVSAGEALEPFSGDEWFEPEEVVEGRWAEHLREVPPGWNYKWHTAWAGHPRPTFEAERRFWNFLLKLDPDRPSWTVPAQPGPWVGPFHWDSRRLRTPEMAALQGFPAGYEFAGNRRERVMQVGNAVPPPLARAAVAAVLDAVETGQQ